MISVTQKPTGTRGVSLISRPRFMCQTPRFWIWHHWEQNLFPKEQSNMRWDRKRCCLRSENYSFSFQPLKRSIIFSFLFIWCALKTLHFWTVFIERFSVDVRQKRTKTYELSNKNALVWSRGKSFLTWKRVLWLLQKVNSIRHPGNISTLNFTLGSVDYRLRVSLSFPFMWYPFQFKISVYRKCTI